MMWPSLWATKKIALSNITPTTHPVCFVLMSMVVIAKGVFLRMIDNVHHRNTCIFDNKIMNRILD